MKKDEVSQKTIIKILEESATIKIILARKFSQGILQPAQMCIHCCNSRGKIVLFGNGGSAADAQHIAAELVGRFNFERQGIPAVALTTNTSILTALGNDYGFDATFARQVQALVKENDVVIAISTSGKSKNVLDATKKAKEKCAKLDAIYFCPHHPDGKIDVYRGDCGYRKPKPSMLELAAAKLNLDLKQSFMIGDKLDDIIAGTKARCKRILVLTGYGKSELNKAREKEIKPDYVMSDLFDAVKLVLSGENQRESGRL